MESKVRNPKAIEKEIKLDSCQAARNQVKEKSNRSYKTDIHLYSCNKNDSSFWAEIREATHRRIDIEKLLQENATHLTFYFHCEWHEVILTSTTQSKTLKNVTTCAAALREVPKEFCLRWKKRM